MAQKDLKLDPKGRYLIQDGTGDIYVYSPALAKREDMREYTGHQKKKAEPKASVAAKPGGGDQDANAPAVAPARLAAVVDAAITLSPAETDPVPEFKEVAEHLGAEYALTEAEYEAGIKEFKAVFNK